MNVLRTIVFLCSLCLVGTVSAQSVLLSPTTTQSITQPVSTNLNILNNGITTSFGNFGISYTSTINNASVTTNVNNAFTMQNSFMQCFQQGYNLGNNGTSAQGWSTCKLTGGNFGASVRGIVQLNGYFFTHYGQGDTAANYIYLSAFGGKVAASDEGVEHTVLQNHQIGFVSGSLASGAGTGSNLVSVSALNCSGNCGAVSNGVRYFADGGILLDTTPPSGTSFLTASIAGLGTWTYNGHAYGMYYTLAPGTGTIPTSTAWGRIDPLTCTASTGRNQTYTAVTCNIQLGISPASPGPFVSMVGTTPAHIFLSGPFEEEAVVDSVGTPDVNGVQAITFETRYAWDSPAPDHSNINNALVMQGGPGGSALVASASASSWPIAYAVVGATSPTQVFFSNCVVGYCNGYGGYGNVLLPPISAHTGGILNRVGNVVTSTSNTNIYSYIVGSKVAVSGYTPSDLNGSFTVLSNSYDASNPLVTWAQTGADETSTTTGVTTTDQIGITFYPSAFITGINGGTTNKDVQLATNSVTYATGDALVGAPSSEFGATGMTIVQGQNSPVDLSQGSGAINILDDGPSPMAYAFRTVNNHNGESGVANSALNLNGSYGNVIYMKYRPANNGALLYVQGNEPVSANSKPYSIFQDHGAPGGNIDYNPSTAVFTFRGGGVIGGLVAPSLTATSAASTLAAGTTVGGSIVCTSTANCQLTGTTPSIGGSALSAGSCSTGTVTVTGAIVGHPVGVSASDGTLPNPLIVLSAAVTATNTVSVQVCAISAVTPVAKTYRVSTY